MNEQIIELAGLGMLGMLTALPLQIILHELGHLIGGRLSGYSFSSISCFGISLCRKGSGMALEYRPDRPLGQCIMRPADIGTDPSALILGGSAANITVGTLLALAGLCSGSIRIALVLICSGATGIVLGLANLYLGGPCSDGATFREIRSGSDQAEIYNRLMLIYSELEMGGVMELMSPELFKGSGRVRTGLEAELDGLHKEWQTLTEGRL